jgi:hypothetical protein
VNEGPLIEGFRAHGILASPAHAEGTVRLERIEDCEDMRCMVLSMRLHVTDFTMAELPGQMEIEDTALAVEMAGWEPIDADRLYVRARNRMQMRMQASVPGPRGPIPFTVVSIREGEERRTEL